MRTVHKHQMTENRLPIQIDGAGLFLHFAMQRGVPTLWMEVDPHAEKVERTFTIVGTGHDVPDDAGYCGTTLDGSFVWHLYVEKA